MTKIHKRIAVVFVYTQLPRFLPAMYGLQTIENTDVSEASLGMEQNIPRLVQELRK